MIKLRRFLPGLGRVAAMAAACLLALGPAPQASANHGDIHATCNGNQPVVTQRPKGAEHVTVVCVDGIPEFTVTPAPVPTYDPITQARPQQVPPDFGGWVTVWLNGHPLVTPYDPIRGLQEPGPYLAKSTGRVMMPVRFFTEAFGGKVEWDQAQFRATLRMDGRGKSVQLWLNKKEAQVGATKANLDQKPVLFLDRMFVPVRFLGEGFGAQVTWDNANSSVRVELSGARCASTVYCGEVR